MVHVESDNQGGWNWVCPRYLYISGGPKNDSTSRVDFAPLIFLINYEFHLTEFGKSKIVWHEVVHKFLFLMRNIYGGKNLNIWRGIIFWGVIFWHKSLSWDRSFLKTHLIWMTNVCMYYDEAYDNKTTAPSTQLIVSLKIAGERNWPIQDPLLINTTCCFLSAI